MPLRGSTATASCENLPIAFRGTGGEFVFAAAETSKQYPCGWLKPPARVPTLSTWRVLPRVVSSHEIQLPQGVRPPAQLVKVPLKLTKSVMTAFVFGSMIKVVV